MTAWRWEVQGHQDAGGGTVEEAEVDTDREVVITNRAAVPRYEGGAMNGGQVARELADLALGTFGAVRPTAAQRKALAESLIDDHAVRWINDELRLAHPVARRSALRRGPCSPRSLDRLGGQQAGSRLLAGRW